VSPPYSMAVIEPHFSKSGLVEVLLATQEGSVIIVDREQAEDQVKNNQV